MDFKDRLHEDIIALENELQIAQDEKAYNDKSDFYLLNRLAELRVIRMQRRIIEQGQEIMNLDSKHDSAEMKSQIEQVKAQILQEQENNKEYEFQYQNFANLYLGMDNSLKSEMSKILDEYAMEGMNVSKEIIMSTDAYMFENYALTDEKLKKASSDGDGGIGLGMARENESFMEE